MLEHRIIAISGRAIQGHACAAPKLIVSLAPYTGATESRMCIPYIMYIFGYSKLLLYTLIL